MDGYWQPDSLEAALTRLGQTQVTLLAGGTDLYAATGARALAGDILDLTAVPELQGIVVSAAGVRIGAAVSWAEIAMAKLPNALAGLQQAAREVGGVQIQNRGTVGGNLCNASPAADGVVPLLTLEAEVELASAAGLRRMPLDQFILGPRKTALGRGELLLAVHVPRQATMGRALFSKLGARKYLVISIVSVAARLVEREGRIADLAIAVGACSAVPRRLPGLEAALRGRMLSDVTGGLADGDVAAQLSPLDDIRASADYRGVAATELVRRALRDLAGLPA